MKIYRHYLHANGTFKGKIHFFFSFQLNLVFPASHITILSNNNFCFTCGCNAFVELIRNEENQQQQQNSEFSQLMHIINLIFYIAMLNVNIEEVICDEKATTTTKRKKKKLYTKLI